MNSYSDLNDAYNTASDLLHSQSNCVYDNIVDDNNGFYENLHHMKMFTTQGDFKSYDDVNNIYGAYNGRKDLPFSIDRKNPELQNETEQEKPTEIASLGSIEYSEENNDEQEINNSKILQHTSECKMKTQNLEKQINETNLSKEDEHKIKTLVKESFRDMMNKSRNITSKLENYNDIFLTEVRDIVLIILIGILVIILLDLLVKIARKI